MKQNKPKYTIIIPTLNEEKTISKVIEDIPKRIKKQSELIIVDGLSKDRTQELAKKAGAQILIEKRKGKGQAIITGIEKAKGEYVILIDADYSTPPKEILNLIKFVPEYDLVIGSRYLNKKYGTKLLHIIGNTAHNKIASILFGTKITDINSGFKIIKTLVAKRLELKEKGFTIEAEIHLKAIKKNFKDKEVAYDVMPRTEGESKIMSFRDGLKILFYIIKTRFFD